MKLSDLNDWLSLLANLGVLIGIFALIAEINQSNTIAEVSAYQSRMTEMESAQRDIATSPQLAGLLARHRESGVDSLDPAEYMQVRAWYNGVIQRMQNQYYQFARGFLEEESAENMFDAAVEGYDRWVELDLLDSISNSEWHAEILRRREQAGLATGN